jgi:hypothetical protein
MSRIRARGIDQFGWFFFEERIGVIETEFFSAGGVESTDFQVL